jgi:replicative DNA helicase
MQIAEHLAVDNGIPVGVFSMEMSRKALSRRMLFSRARVDLRKYLNGFFENERRDVPALTASIKALKDAPLIVDEQPGLTAEQLSMRARRMVRDGAKLIILDYIQLMRGGSQRFKDRNAELTHVSQTLVTLKKELKIPIIVLCQMNRAIETSEKRRRPMLSDIKDCGQIEQDADVVLFVDEIPIKGTEHNPDDEKLRFLSSAALDEIPVEWRGQEWRKHLKRVDVFVGKQRDGESGIAAECVMVRRWVRLMDCFRSNTEQREAAHQGEVEEFA